MIKPDSFILNDFNEEQLQSIIYYIKNRYERDSIIYGSVGFFHKAADTIIGPLKEDVYYKSLDEADPSEVGLVGSYKGAAVYCVPELKQLNAFVVPDWRKE